MPPSVDKIAGATSLNPFFTGLDMNNQNRSNIPMSGGRAIASRGAEAAERALKRVWEALRR
jgi:hypothetical protein